MIFDIPEYVWVATRHTAYEVDEILGIAKTSDGARDIVWARVNPPPGPAKVKRVIKLLEWEVPDSDWADSPDDTSTRRARGTNYYIERWELHR